MQESKFEMKTTDDLVDALKACINSSQKYTKVRFVDRSYKKFVDVLKAPEHLRDSPLHVALFALRRALLVVWQMNPKADWMGGPISPEALRFIQNLPLFGMKATADTQSLCFEFDKVFFEFTYADYDDGRPACFRINVEHTEKLLAAEEMVKALQGSFITYAQEPRCLERWRHFLHAFLSFFGDNKEGDSTMATVVEARYRVMTQFDSPIQVVKTAEDDRYAQYRVTTKEHAASVLVNKANYNATEIIFETNNRRYSSTQVLLDVTEEPTN